MKYKNGEQAAIGDVIRWRCWDSDDLTTWTCTGLVKDDGVLYLGGGIDFGSAIGNIYSYGEVVSESENNDPDESGIEKVGIAADLYRYILFFNN